MHLLPDKVTLLPFAISPAFPQGTHLCCEHQYLPTRPSDAPELSALISLAAYEGGKHDFFFMLKAHVYAIISPQAQRDSSIHPIILPHPHSNASLQWFCSYHSSHCRSLVNSLKVTAGIRAIGTESCLLKFALFPRRYELPLHPQLLEGMDQNLFSFSDHHILLGVKHTGQHLRRCWTNICSQNVLRSSVPRSVQACLQTHSLVFHREQALETKQHFQFLEGSLQILIEFESSAEC